MTSVHSLRHEALNKIQQETKNWGPGVIRIEELDCRMKVFAGDPYCSGGCHGLMLDWLYMIKDRKPNLWNKLPPWAVVMGKYKGDVAADRIMVVGDCSEVTGKLKVRKKRRIKGCPPMHKDLVLWYFLKAGIVNPFLRLDLIFDAYPCLFFSLCKRLIKGRL